MSLKKEEVKIDSVEIEPFVNDEYRGFTFYWCGNIGFGEYTIYKSAGDDQWHASSEMMDSDDDIWFLDLLFEKFKSMLKIH